MSDMVLSDLGRVAWLPTLKLALGRGVASALVLGLVGTLTGFFRTPNAPDLLAFVATWSLMSFIAAPLMSYMIQAIRFVMARFVGGIAVLTANIMLAMLSLMVASGDPIIFALNKGWPGLFEAGELKLFNFRLLIFVLNDHPF